MLKVALNTINHLYKFCKVIKFYTHCISNIKCTYMYNSKHMCNVFLNFLFLWLFSPDIWQSYICIYSKVIFINIYLDICMLFKVGRSTYRYINILMVSHVTAPIILNKNKKIESHIVYTVPVHALENIKVILFKQKKLQPNEKLSLDMLELLLFMQ